MTPEDEPKKIICEPPPPLFAGERLFTGLLALAMSAAALVFAHQLGSHYLLAQGFQNGIDRPVLAIELPRSAADIQQVLGVDDNNPSKAEERCNTALRGTNVHTLPRTADDFDHLFPEAQKLCKAALAVGALQTNTYEDFVFIVLYVLFLWRFARLFAIRANGAPMVLGKVVGLLALATGMGDCVENYGILSALGAERLTDNIADAIRWLSSCKWVLFGAALLVTSVILLRSGSALYSLATRRLLAIGYAISGALLVVGPLHPHSIESGTGLFALLVFINMVALLGPYIARLAPEDIPEYMTDFCQRKKEGKADVAVRPHHGA
jgi:hypothetical protein